MQTDFLIVGAGAVGMTTAQVLLRAGYRVTLVERGESGKQASWAGGGILSTLSPWDYSEPVNQLALRSMAMFEQAMAELREATGVDTEYQRCGMLLLPPLPSKDAAHWCQSHGMSLQQVDLADCLPTQHGQPYAGSGLLLPEIAQVRNPRLLQALRKHVQMLGGNILEHHEVIRLEMQGNRIAGVQTSQGVIGAEAVVITAGAWSRELLGEYALQLDIRPIRGQMLLFRFERQPFGPILLSDGLYLIPRRDGHMLVGSTLEDVGFDPATTPEARNAMLRRVWEIFPDWHGLEPVRQWSGFRPGTPHNLPVIDRHPDIGNLYVNSGHFRYGVTMSLASARLLLDVIEGREETALNPRLFRWH